MKISNSKDLALAIVASSSPTLSIEDKIKLYEDSVWINSRQFRGTL